MITLKMARVGADYTQEEIAKMLGVHAQTYAKWEKDSTRMTIGEAKEFSKIVGIPVSDIFFGFNSN